MTLRGFLKLDHGTTLYSYVVSILKKFCHTNYIESEYSSKVNHESFHRISGGDRIIG